MSSSLTDSDESSFTIYPPNLSTKTIGIEDDTSSPNTTTIALAVAPSVANAPDIIGMILPDPSLNIYAGEVMKIVRRDLSVPFLLLVVDPLCQP